MASHRSRLCAALIDVPRDGYEAETAFWARALGRPGTPEADDPSYTTYGEPLPGLEFMVQAIGAGAARVHLDIETDDVEAEVSRLERLGATVVERPETWVVMSDPAGLLFCVVVVQNPAVFAASATTWTA